MSNWRRSTNLGAIALVAIAGLAPAQVAAASKVVKDSFSVEISASVCSVGKECKAEISLNSTDPFRINDKYPIKFKMPEAAPEGVTFAKDVVQKKHGTFTETEGLLPVGFTVAKAGKVSIGGTFSFSVCSDANCIIEKVVLAVDVDAK